MQWEVKNNHALIDELVEIKLINLPANTKIKLIATTKDWQGYDWSSSAIFLSNAQGEIDLTQQAPLSGDYAGVNPMGLFSMLYPDQPTKASLFSLNGFSPFNITLRAYLKATCLGEYVVTRHIKADAVQRIEVDQPEVTGILFLPDEVKQHPAIALIPGTSGPYALECMAALLASRGYAVFIIAIYRYKHLPDEMYHLPLERIRSGIQWLKSQPQINSDKVTAMGVSKGAEALLATLAYFPDLKLSGIIAQSPSHVAWQGIGKGRPRQECSWSVFHEPLHYLSYLTVPMWFEMLSYSLARKIRFTRLFLHSKGVRCIKGYQSALRNKRATDEARIPVQHLKAPLLLISGQADALWPSESMCEAIKAELTKHQFKYPVTHLNLAGAGHLLTYPGLPTTITTLHLPHLSLCFGGEAKKWAQANQIYWASLLAFLTEVR